MVETVLKIVGFSSFLILLLEKLKIWEWMQLKGSKKVSEFASCEFCKSFWFCFTISPFTVVDKFSIFNYVAVLLLSTCVTRKLIW